PRGLFHDLTCNHTRLLMLLLVSYSEATFIYSSSITDEGVNMFKDRRYYKSI
ncbi:hypothetical protein ACJX0J_038252, partial [Zea mays]